MVKLPSIMEVNPVLQFSYIASAVSSCVTLDFDGKVVVVF